MLKFARKYRVLCKNEATNLWIDQEKKLVSFAKGDLLYLFNFNTTESDTNFFMHAHTTGAGVYKAVFSSDEKEFCGQERVSLDYLYHTSDKSGKGLGFEVYIPCRTVVVFQKVA